MFYLTSNKKSSNIKLKYYTTSLNVVRIIKRLFVFFLFLGTFLFKDINSTLEKRCGFKNNDKNIVGFNLPLCMLAFWLIASTTSNDMWYMIVYEIRST